MLKVRSAFASFSTNDIEAARAFYGDKLGLEVKDSPMGAIEVMLGSDQHVMIYPKPNHEPASYTVLNLMVADIDEAVDDLAALRIATENYDIPQIKQDAKGIARDPEGPAIAWFKDPAGNTLAVVQQS